MSSAEPIWDIEIPEGKNPKEYSFRERRKDILDYIWQVGNLKLVSISELAKKYGKSYNMIKKDIASIKKYIIENLGKEMQLDTSILYEKAIREYTKKGNYKEAWKILEGMNEFLFNIGKVKKAPSQLQIEGKITAEEIIRKFDEFEKK